MIGSWYKVMFLSSLMGGTLMVVSASTWMMAWVGLELNMLSFIPLMVEGETEALSAEAGLKYFIVQALASMILLVGSFFGGMQSLSGEWGLYMIGVSLVLKLGLAPLHQWLPSVAECLTWKTLGLLFVWQSIAPFSLLHNVVQSGEEGWENFKIVIVLSLVVGGLGGFLQNSLPKMMAYSSINHMGWMVGSLKVGGNAWIGYLGVYTILTIMTLRVFHQGDCYTLSHLKDPQGVTTMESVPIFLSFFSLGGLPPFLGFFPKWWVVQGLLKLEQSLVPALMVVVSLVALYLYFRMAFSTFVITEFVRVGQEGVLSEQKPWKSGWGVFINWTVWVNVAGGVGGFLFLI